MFLSIILISLHVQVAFWELWINEHDDDDDVQLLSTDNVEQVNKYLDGLDWLSLAGVSQCVRSAAERDKVVSYASHWLCLGRTRQVLERHDLTSVPP